jgi:hypothetical protein
MLQTIITTKYLTFSSLKIGNIRKTTTAEKRKFQFLVSYSLH